MDAPRTSGRGARITAILPNGRAAIAYHDGRATAAENGEERSGVALSPGGLTESFTPVGDGPVAKSPQRRRWAALPQHGRPPDGGYR